MNGLVIKLATHKFKAHSAIIRMRGARCEKPSISSRTRHLLSVILHRRATSPGGGAGRRDLDHVSVAAGVAFAPGRLAIALPVQEQGAKNTLFFASYSILSVMHG